MTTDLLWQPYRYLPYERRLAAMEVERLAKTRPEPIERGLRVPKRLTASITKHFTYFAEAVDASGAQVIPDQARFEASVPRNGDCFADGAGSTFSRPRCAKQITRYSAHGLHEYRGKFNPQVVRAACNILGIRPGSLLCDPFCGSGTVLLEAAHMGCNSLGCDLHPLAIEIANAKLTAYHTPRAEFREATTKLLDSLDPIASVDDKKLRDVELSRCLGKPVDDLLPNMSYLREWFPARVLKQLAAILFTIDAVVPQGLQQVYRIVLSDIVREVSWQDPADLRIRRRAVPQDDYPALRLFVAALRKKSAVIVSTPSENVGATLSQVACRLDSRDASSIRKALKQHFGKRRVDAVVSSPPYATALPYVDMHRLSLCLLGLIQHRQIREAEKWLIGNREISDLERRLLVERMKRNEGNLPAGCFDLCCQMLLASELPGNGFRRRNTPPLLYKYLEDMKSSFVAVGSVLRRGAPLAFVVGPNRCSLGGQEFAVNTPVLLREIAEVSGFAFEQLIELDAYQRYDLHQQNSIRTETLLVLRRL